MAGHAIIQVILEIAEVEELQSFIVEKHDFYADPLRGFVSRDDEEPFASWFVLDANGYILARSPQFTGQDFGWRDYFQGARALEPAGSRNRSPVYVSKVYQAKLGDHLYKFAISVPVRDENESERLLGVVVASITSDSTLGTLLPKAGQQKAVLIGVRDATGPPGTVPDRPLPGNVILGHPTFGHGAPAVPIDNDILLDVQHGRIDPENSHDDHYIDPVYGGRWLAGFARVPDTEFVVIVQQPYDEAVRPFPILVRLLILWGGVALCPLVIILGATLLHGLQRTMKADPGRPRSDNSNPPTA